MYFAAKLPPASGRAQISTWGMLICAQPTLATRFGDFYKVTGLCWGAPVGAAARDQAGAGRCLVGATPLARVASSLTVGTGYRAPRAAPRDPPPPAPHPEPRAVTVPRDCRIPAGRNGGESATPRSETLAARSIAAAGGVKRTVVAHS